MFSKINIIKENIKLDSKIYRVLILSLCLVYLVGNTFWFKEFPYVLNRGINLSIMVILMLTATVGVKTIEKNEVLNEEVKVSNSELNKFQEINEELYNLANIDPLTNTFNRRRAMAEIEKLIQVRYPREEFALLFMDLDRFKSVNDNYGHDIGDLLLKETARRVKNILNSGDILSRQGGDEFIILLKNSSDMERVQIKCKKIVEEMKKEFLLNQKKINTSVSIGVAFYPKDAETISGILKSADLALYKAKHMGKSRYVIFNEKLKEIENRKMDIDRCLYRSIEENELDIIYHPQINLQTGKMIGAKGVLRWKSKELGEVSAHEFISVAEENGFVRELGKFFLKRVAGDIAFIQKNYDPNFNISFNVSPKQFYTDELIPKVQEVLESSGLTQGSMIFEIFENVPMKNQDIFMEKFEKLIELGIKLSIDDFGTEYSSISHLRKYPISGIKISKEFISGIEGKEQDYKIVKGVIDMCRNLGITISAEGVESVEQLYMLNDLGCDIVQGNAVSRPLKLLDLEKKFKQM